MGHRDTSEEFGGARGVCGAGGGFTATAEELVGRTDLDSPIAKMTLSQIEEDRLKSVPPATAARAALFALRFYKAYLSILFAGSCRFEPTCSRYAYEAIERFGVIRGVWLGLKRLLRCQPLSRKFGYDPVPEKWEDRSSEMKPAASNTTSSATVPNEVHS